jgi:hypothetical protein
VKKVALGWLLINAALLPAVLPAQTPQGTPAARTMPRPDDIEPGVDTSAGEHGTAPAATSAAQSASAAPAAASVPAQAAHGKKVKPGAKPADSASAPVGKAQDRIQLDATSITGNRELPKVMVIVPWKHADLGDLADKPMNSLVDEVLQPIDRDVFQRQTRYYDALKPDAVPANAAASAPPASPQ